jgi:hypothetical protein
VVWWLLYPSGAFPAGSPRSLLGLSGVPVFNVICVQTAWLSRRLVHQFLKLFQQFLRTVQVAFLSAFRATLANLATLLPVASATLCEARSKTSDSLACGAASPSFAGLRAPSNPAGVAEQVSNLAAFSSPSGFVATGLPRRWSRLPRHESRLGQLEVGERAAKVPKAFGCETAAKLLLEEAHQLVNREQTSRHDLVQIDEVLLSDRPPMAKTFIVARSPIPRPSRAVARSRSRPPLATSASDAGIG